MSYAETRRQLAEESSILHFELSLVQQKKAMMADDGVLEGDLKDQVESKIAALAAAAADVDARIAAHEDAFPQIYRDREALEERLRILRGAQASNPDQNFAEHVRSAEAALAEVEGLIAAYEQSSSSAAASE